MSNAFELNCSVRQHRGKAASRRLRRLHGQIPAILYGGEQEPVALTIAHDDMLHATENEAFFSRIITLHIDNQPQQAVIKALQRHPAKPFILHADFLRISDQKTIVVKVPIHFINESRCVGVKLGGGNILKTLNEIEVSCLPEHLPEYIEVDMLEVQLGESVHLSDVALPVGVSSVALSHGEDSNLSVAIVQAPRGGASDDQTAEADDTTAARPDADKPAD